MPSPAVLHWSDYYWVYLFAFCIGASTTDRRAGALIAVAMKANQVSGGRDRRMGPSDSQSLSALPSVFRWGPGGSWPESRIQYFIIPGYVFVVIQTWFRAQDDHTARL